MVGIVSRHLADPAFSVASLAGELGLSSRQLQRVCRDLTGLGPADFVRRARLEEAKRLLERRAFRTVKEFAAAVGASARAAYASRGGGTADAGDL